ncbi:MAG: hypothetical protein ACO3YY_02565 [Phycisphaerales bacterium]
MPDRSDIRMPTMAIAAMLAVAGVAIGAPVRIDDAADSDAAPPPAFTDAERRDRLREEAFARLRETMLPEAVDAATLETWAREVGFSDEGLALLAAIDANYREAWRRAELGGGAAIRNRLEATYRFDDRIERIEPVPTPELLELLAAREQLVDRIATAEDALFREFEALADPMRRAALADIRHERRQRVLRRPERLPGATVDLVDLLAEESVDVSAIPGGSGLVDRYRRRHAEALEARFREGLAIDREEAELHVEIGPAWELLESPEDAAEIAETLRDLERRRLELDVPMRALNRDALLELRPALAEADGRRVQRRYQALTYPEFFRDEGRFDALLANPALDAVLDDARRGAVEVVRDETFRDLQRSSLLSMELADALVPVETLPDPLARAEAQMLIGLRLIEIGEQRRARLDAAARDLRNLLPTESGDAAASIETFLAEHESLRRAAAFRRDRLAEAAAALRTMSLAPPIAADPIDDAAVDDAPGSSDAP